VNNTTFGICGFGGEGDRFDSNIPPVQSYPKVCLFPYVIRIRFNLSPDFH
jgi:hypothetical protein